MYSIVLLLAMTPAMEVQQIDLVEEVAKASKGGLFFSRSGCLGGATYNAPLATAAGNVAAGWKARVEARREFRAEAKKASTFQSASCSGGSAVLTGETVTTTTTVTTSTSGAPTVVTAQGAFLQRAAIHRTLHQALRQGKIDRNDMAEVRYVLRDGRLYNKLVEKVYDKFHAKIAAEPGDIQAQAIGDGTLVKLFLANLPAIIEFIKQVIELFGWLPSFEAPGLSPPWLPMPQGPHPPARAIVPQLFLVC